jgi:acyl-CoA synthetase (AMP-forming)/AMP-acid ligase II
MSVNSTMEPVRPQAGGRVALNVAARLSAVALKLGDRPAIQIDRGSRPATIGFAQLESLCKAYASGIARSGIERGNRVVLMLRPGVDFVAVMFALFRIGAVPVLIDPGMGAGRLLECIQGAKPQAFIGIPLAHVVRVFRRGPFRSVRTVITQGRRWFWGGDTLSALSRNVGEIEAAATLPDEPAAILFTSGSTGPAKGVVYTHGMFDAQIRAIQTHFGMAAGEVDLPGFAPFALFSVAMGMTVVFPEMDFSRPARVDPRRIVKAVERFRPSNATGSPAMWGRVADYCLAHDIRLGSLRRVLMFGAPISERLLEKVRRILGPAADVHTPYGATEALPVSSIKGSERLAAHRADCGRAGREGGQSIPRGICVGRAVGETQIRILRLCEEPIPKWTDDLLAVPGTIGEIAVAGPVVTEAYFRLAEATSAAKIKDGDRVWHRMGDVGRMDEEGRLWFCGRKAHRVVTANGTLFSVPCEMVFNDHPNVNRSALVGVGPVDARLPVIVVEPVAGRYPRGKQERFRFQEELRRRAMAFEHTASIGHFLFHRSFPVDVRHNTKIDREALGKWAAGRV